MKHTQHPPLPLPRIATLRRHLNARSRLSQEYSTMSQVDFLKICAIVSLWVPHLGSLKTAIPETTITGMQITMISKTAPKRQSQPIPHTKPTHYGTILMGFTAQTQSRKSPRNLNTAEISVGNPLTTYHSTWDPIQAFV